MSLPTKAKFFINGELVYTMSVNVGWVMVESKIPQAIRNSLDLYKEYVGEELNFNTVEAYGFIYTKERIWARSKNLL